ncbi:iron complex transport system permease protein [Friedmanniella endophytica]|uniref:Iron complex transport system permease protein n=1 Tax=Microlunatus kandeliicorticis TaxID=1759536 RepID=A0A7W3IRN1_9ACTN|nr:iron chelate uptake ABC transporter family permease subunit [Microlunatus kandeliicorticis]MBA8794014.1 iron complex transport system permease protein [Microlunatus kandeliicorticis]
MTVGAALRSAAPGVPVPARATGPSGPRARRRSLLVGGLVLCAVVLALLALVSLAVGTRAVPLGTVVEALTRYDPADTDQLVVVTLRIPRTVVGLLVGAALGLAGCVMQGVTRNPLADPGILGVNAGAALFVVLAIGVLGVSSVGGYVWFAFAGAALAAVVVYAVAAVGREGATPVKLALAGAALTAGFGAVTTALLLLDQRTFDEFRFWQVGSLTGRDLGVVAAVSPFLAVGGLLALGLGRSLNTLALGDEVARGLGARVGTVRLVSALSVVLLCGAATAAAGPIGFVGLVIPHLARTLVGPDHRWLLPYSMLLGPVLLLAADVLGRVIARPAEVQVAIVTAVIGAPVFIALVRRRKLATA